MLSGCHGPVARDQDGWLLAVRGHGVIAFGSDSEVAAVGGPLDRGARIPPGAEGAYVFATTGPPGPVYRGSHLLTRLTGAVGRNATLPVNYVGAISRTAVLPGDRLYLVDGYYAGSCRSARGWRCQKISGSRPHRWPNLARCCRSTSTGSSAPDATATACASIST